jgi:hypothetical protein
MLYNNKVQSSLITYKKIFRSGVENCSITVPAETRAMSLYVSAVPFLNQFVFSGGSEMKNAPEEQLIRLKWVPTPTTTKKELNTRLLQ